MNHPATDEWARRLAEIRHLMAEQAASLDASGDFPRDNIDRLRQRGFLSLAVPLQYGGAGADLPRLQQAIAAIAWGEPATALIVCMQYLHHLRLAENENWSEPLRQRVFHDAVERGGLINSLRVEPELGSPARGGLPLGVLAALLGASAATGLLASAVASALASRGELLAALRAE